MDIRLSLSKWKEKEKLETKVKEKFETKVINISSVFVLYFSIRIFLVQLLTLKTLIYVNDWTKILYR